MLAVFRCVSFSLRLSFRLITRSCESGLFSFLVLARRRESWAPLPFSPLAHFPSSLSPLAEISIRVVTRMRNERPFILSASPIRARIERGARESIRRKPQIVNILERARTKLAAGKCGAPKLRLCVRRARCTRRTYFIARARLFSLAAWDFSSFRTRVRAPFYFVLFCPFFLLLFVSALLTCATLWSHRPSLLTRRFFSLSLRISLSASLSLLSSSFFFTSCLLAHLSAH